MKRLKILLTVALLFMISLAYSNQVQERENTLDVMDMTIDSQIIMDAQIEISVIVKYNYTEISPGYHAINLQTIKNNMELRSLLNGENRYTQIFHELFNTKLVDEAYSNNGKLSTINMFIQSNEDDTNKLLYSLIHERFYSLRESDNDNRIIINISRKDTLKYPLFC